MAYKENKMKGFRQNGIQIQREKLSISTLDEILRLLKNVGFLSL